MAVFKSKSSAYMYYAGGGTLAFIIVLIAFASYSSGTPKSLITNATESLRSDLLDDIWNSTLGFQKIFVINLPSRTDHADAMALTASVTGLEIGLMDGITEVAPKAVPPGDAVHKLGKGELGSWRAHMNIAQRMVRENIASVLVMEDDVDWDLRIKDQMQDFARASRLLVQPLSGTTDKYLDPTYPHPAKGDTAQNLYVDHTSRTAKPTTSPYGDLANWDALWIGHCGTYFPSTEKSLTRPVGRAVLLDDATVPEPQHIDMMYSSNELIDQYPPHTRVVTRANMNMCTFAYALSLPGARRLLYELSLHKLEDPMDVSLRSFCDGYDGRRTRKCLTVQPQLMQHHRPVGNKSTFSDLGDHGDEVNEEAFTRNIRWSTRLNMEKLMEGETDYVDLFQDGEPGKDWGWGR